MIYLIRASCGIRNNQETQDASFDLYTFVTGSLVAASRPCYCCFQTVSSFCPPARKKNVLQQRVFVTQEPTHYASRPQPGAQLTLHKCGTVASHRTEPSWLCYFSVKSDPFLTAAAANAQRGQACVRLALRRHMRPCERRRVDSIFWANNGGFYISNRQSASLFLFFSSFHSK